MPDPTIEELRTFLKTQQDGLEPDIDEFDREEAIYWFAADYHGGQWSNLYSALSTSEYHPGPLTNGPDDDTLYDALVTEYVHTVQQ